MAKIETYPGGPLMEQEARQDITDLIKQRELVDRAAGEKFYFDLLMKKQNEILRADPEHKLMPRQAREQACWANPGLREAAFAKTIEERVRGALQFHQEVEGHGPKAAYNLVAKHCPAHCRFWSKRGYAL